jgi:putative transposase
LLYVDLPHIVEMKQKKVSASKSAKREAALGVLTRVLRVRIKDKHASFLLAQALEVNQVWNFCNETGSKILEREGRFCSNYDLDALTAGATKEGLSLHSQTVQAISSEYCTRRAQFKKRKLRWRVSKGSRRSLGWIPFKASAIKFKNGQVHYQGKAISLWDSFGLKDFELRSGSFSEDARGRWYLNITVSTPELCGPRPQKRDSVGIDLGLRELVAFSDLELKSVEAQRFYRDLEPALATAQRAGKKDRTKAIHAKIANRRKDFLHKLSTQLVKSYGVIVVGNVSSSALAKTKMAKSVLDSGWGMFKTQLMYKSHGAAAVFEEVNESYSTQECSACGARTGPKGLDDLGVTEWTCSGCGVHHDRNQNAAQNILVRGLFELNKRKPATGEVRACEAVVNEDLGSFAAISGPGHGPLAVGIPGL